MNCNKSSVKNINSLLNFPKTRCKGLQYLNSYLPYCSQEDFVEYCTSWMHYCCKIDGFSDGRNLASETLNSLFRASSNCPDLSKSVSFFISNRFFDYFFKYLVNTDYGWACAKTCFEFYRGPCGPSQEVIENHLLNEFKKNIKFPVEVSDCFALLPCLGGGGNEGINYITKWENQFKTFIEMTHSTLNSLFVDFEEIQEYGKKHKSEKNQFNINHLTVQLYNQCRVLQSMLVINYPAPKHIPIDSALELICRGLAINPVTLKKSKSFSNLLSEALPEIHVILFHFLNSLIVACGSQLLPYSFVITKLIKQTLEWTQSSNLNENQAFSSLRISAYEVGCNWLLASKNGGFVDYTIISHIICDIEFKRNMITLKEVKSMQKESSNISQKSYQTIVSSFQVNLCYAALQVLQYLLKFSGVLLRMEDHKCLQETVLKILISIQSSCLLDISIPYSVPICRKALYNVLLELVKQPCYTWPPPTQFAFRIFKIGENDKDSDVAQFCSSALSTLTMITHHQFCNGQLITSESITEQQGKVNLLSTEKPIEQERCEININVNSNLEKESVINSDLKNDVTSINEDEIYINSVPEENSLSTKPSSSSLIQELCGRTNICEFQERLENSDEGESGKDAAKCLAESAITSDSKSDVNLISEDESNLKPTTKENSLSPKPYDTVDISDNDEPKTKKSSNIDSSKLSSASMSEKSEPDETELPVDAGNSVVETVKNFNTLQCSPKIISSGVDIEVSDNSKNDSSTAADMSGDEENFMDVKKHYFLRSKKCESPSEKFEESLKPVDSLHSLRNTPVRNLGKSTPTGSLSSKKRPRTRAVSKLEALESDVDFKTPKKSEQDEDNDIVNVFDDSFKR